MVLAGSVDMLKNTVYRMHAHLLSLGDCSFEYTYRGGKVAPVILEDYLARFVGLFPNHDSRALSAFPDEYPGRKETIDVRGSVVRYRTHVPIPYPVDFGTPDFTKDFRGTLTVDFTHGIELSVLSHRTDCCVLVSGAGLFWDNRRSLSSPYGGVSPEKFASYKGIDLEHRMLFQAEHLLQRYVLEHKFI